MSKTSGSLTISSGNSSTLGGISGELIIKEAPDAHLKEQWVQEERNFFGFKYNVKVKYVYGHNGWQPVKISRGDR